MNDTLEDLRPFSSHSARGLQTTKEPGPYVGIFYVVQGTLYWEGVPIDRAEKTALFKIYPKKHYTYWKMDLARFVPEFKNCDPLLFPRGRVVYDPKSDIYELMTDKCVLEDSDLVKRIVSEMGLSESKLTVSHDISCECDACRDTVIPDELCNDRQVQILGHGGKLFFPWGRGRGRSGYIIPSEREYRRVRDKLKYWGITLIAVVYGVAELIGDYLADNRYSFGAALFAICLMGILIFMCIWTGIRWETRNLKKYTGLPQ
jgi:hypothetical protein